MIDDFENNNINEETQNSLKQYYNSLNKEGEINIIYKKIVIQVDIIQINFHCKICLMKLDLR